MVLLVTLSLLVLATVASTAFFTRAVATRPIEAFRANQVLVQQLAESGADHAIARFPLEMASNAITTVVNGMTNYVPAPAGMLPQRLLAQTSMAADTNFINLVRQSVPGADPNASSHGVATASQNGRLITATRWNAPYLLTGGGFTTPAQLPRWIYITRDGTLTKSITTNNCTNIIGRFAYNAYDVGGLLDANVAGYPDSVTKGSSYLTSLKGTLAGADLSLIPWDDTNNMSAADMDKFVRWRNAGSATNATNYVDTITAAAARGFLAQSAGGLKFNSRQDLIRIALARSYGITTNGLPYLTHYSKELARPSLTNNELNRMTRRYDLSQLTNLAKANLGLRGAASNYFYTNTLADTVSSTNPNLFQIIRAAVAYTNSWESDGPTNVFSTTSALSWTTNANLKAVALGANLIDQFGGTTNNPTRITYVEAGTSSTVAGKKQLPYIMGVYVAYNVEAQYFQNSQGTYKVNTNANTGQGKAVGNPGTGNEGNTKTVGNAGGGSNSITVYVSLIPQVWYPGGASGSTTLTAALTGGSIVLGSTNQSFTAATNSIVLPPSASAGAAAVYLTPTNANLVQRGFFQTSVTVPTNIISTLRVNLSGLSFAIKSGSGVYNAFGTNTNAGSASLVSAALTLSARDLSSSPIDTNTTTPAITDLAGLFIAAQDPRTPRGAGSVVVVAETNETVFTSLPSGLSNNVVTNNYFPTASRITDTIIMTPTNRINGVGELGAVFRESPWRTIDFVSGGASPDRNLLDVFSAYPTPAGGVRAGVVNLNTRHPEVIAALLSGTITTGSSYIPSDMTNNTALYFASNMVGLTAVSPLTNRAQLIDLVYSNVIAFSSDTNKQSREAVVRALGEVGQTRTWNLLLDVVAQSGKFSGGTGAENFVVGGEGRVWVSVAIDRLTGRVIDREVEVVAE